MVKKSHKLIPYSFASIILGVMTVLTIDSAASNVEPYFTGFVIMLALTASELLGSFYKINGTQ